MHSQSGFSETGLVGQAIYKVPTDYNVNKEIASATESSQTTISRRLNHTREPCKSLPGFFQTSMTMSSSMAPHDFQTPEVDRRQVRLLHLQPGKFHEPTSANLSLAYLDEHPKYEALSYVWGDTKVCLHINLNGHKMPMTPNLWAALRRGRFRPLLGYKLPVGANYQRLSACR